MRSRFKMALLALGAIGGFASGFAGLHECRSRQSFEQHIASVCIDAAQSHAAPR